MVIMDDVRLRFRCLYVMLATLLITSTIGWIVGVRFREGLRGAPTAIQKQETARRRHHEESPAIAALVANAKDDLYNLCCALKSTNVFLNDNSTVPVLIFNENNLQAFQQWFLASCAHPRPVHFPTVDFRSFPPGFDPDKEPTYMSKRGKWGYHQMIRFWMTTLWKHPAIQEYTTLMRIDSDSCFTEHFSSERDRALPYLAADKVYFASDAEHVDHKFVIDGLWDLAADYVARNNLTVAHPAFWERARDMWTREESLPLFYNNFEVSRISFLQRPDVARWHEAVSEHEPFGVFRGRWGDAPVRFLTMAMFATPDQVLRGKPLGYLHDAKSLCLTPMLQDTMDSYAQMKSNRSSYSPKVDK